MTQRPPPVHCPNCGRTARRSATRYGVRDDCPDCGLWSWDGKKLVGVAVHEARKHCHDAVDDLWLSAPAMYEIRETPGSTEYIVAVRRIQKAARGRTYAWLSEHLGLPEPECHMAAQDDIPTLRRIYAAARGATPEAIRAWAKAKKEAA